MSSQTVDLDDREYTNHELLAMGEDEARAELTYNQYQRWEKLNDLHAEAEATKAEWADQQEQVTELTVHADPEQLGTAIDLFGNDVLVHIDSDDEQFRAASDTLDAEFGDHSPDELDALDADDREALADGLMEMLDAVLVEWNGHEWADLPGDDREALLQTARKKWGVDGLLLAWVDIAAAVRDDREERVDVVESFRGETRPGGR